MAEYTLIVRVTTTEAEYDPGTARALANVLTLAGSTAESWDPTKREWLTVEQVHVSTPDGTIAISS